MQKVITDRDGRMRTEQAADPDEARRRLAQQRRELREMLAGNVPFHTDANAPPAPPVPAPPGDANAPPPVVYDWKAFSEAMRSAQAGACNDLYPTIDLDLLVGVRT